MRYIQRPMNSAMGIVQPMVNVPHGALAQRVDHGQAEAGQRDDDDEEDGDAGGDAGDRADLLAGDLGQRAAVAPHRGDRMMKSCTAPASTTPMTSQRKPGR